MFGHSIKEAIEAKFVLQFTMYSTIIDASFQYSYISFKQKVDTFLFKTGSCIYEYKTA